MDHLEFESTVAAIRKTLNEALSEIGPSSPPALESLIKVSEQLLELCGCQQDDIMALSDALQGHRISNSHNVVFG